MHLKFIKKAAIAAVAAVSIFTVASLSACTIKTKHPTAEITIEFNSQEYVLKYKLYRNMYPVTVQHFIELANSGFYDDTIIHNYQSSDWYGGGYSYNATLTYTDGNGNVVEDPTDYAAEHESASYFSDNSLEQKYMDLFNAGTFTPSVYSASVTLKEDCTNANAISTLYGEFTDNGHVVDNNPLSPQYGGLWMYYTSKTTSKYTYVRTGKNEVVQKNYKYNSATSLFDIQVGSSSALDTSSHCLFGILKSDTYVDTLEDLQSDISDYISANYDTSGDFTTNVSGIYVDNLEEVSTDDQGQEVTYAVTAEPIIIRTVKITKY